MASEITSLTIIYSTVYSGADQRKYQSSASLAFVRGIHRWPVNSLHKGPVTQKMFPFGDDFREFNENVWISNKMSLKFYPHDLIDYIPPMTQVMGCRRISTRIGDKSSPEPMKNKFRAVIGRHLFDSLSGQEWMQYTHKQHPRCVVVLCMIGIIFL